jgi:tetratricopeptide (TPR) repeat protein
MALAGLGEAFNGMKQYESTISLYQQAVRVLHKDLDAFAEREMAVAFFRLGQHQSAVDALQRAIQAEPDFAQAHFDLAITFLTMGRIEEAERVRGDLAKVDQEAADELEKAVAAKKAGG